MPPNSNLPAVEWHPAVLLQSGTDLRDNGSALVILNQPLNDIETLKTLWQNSSLHVAADGGANRLYDLIKSYYTNGSHEASIFTNLHTIIGDLDSLTAETRSHFEHVNPSIDIIHDEDQYSTDFTKAVRHVRSQPSHADRKTRDIVAMGGLGGRVDQGLSQLHHLCLFQSSPDYAEGRIYLVSGESLTFLLKTGRHRIYVREPAKNGGWTDEVFAKYAGIVPIQGPSVITLRGFEWDVEDWPTEFGGQLSTSNHVLPESQYVEVETNNDVLFTIALKERISTG